MPTRGLGRDWVAVLRQAIAERAENPVEPTMNAVDEDRFGVSPWGGDGVPMDFGNDAHARVATGP